MIPQSVRLGKIMGIEIGVNYSWFIVFFLIIFLLATQYFPSAYPKLAEVTYIALGIITSILFFASVLFHELSHSIVAKNQGIPIKSITLFIFGGVAAMSKEPEKPFQEFLMAIAGPLSSFVLAGLFGVIWIASYFLNLGVLVSAPAQYLCLINVILGVFNLVPGFPLDGGRILRSFLWYIMRNLRQATHVVSLMGQIFAFLLIFGGLFLLLLTRQYWLNGLWFIFIGWFLYQAAVTSYEQVLVRGSLRGVRIEQIMTHDVRTVDASINLEDLVNDFFMRYKHGRFPVIDDNRLIGIISLHEVRDVPRNMWPLTLVREVTPPLAAKHAISPRKSAEDAMIKMAEENVGHLLVLNKGRLIGIVTKSDLIGVIQMRRGLGV